MDWYTWLSKANLEKSLVYDYALLFCRNELEEDDIPHFNHEFLQSMGISIAKHRLEILKLSKSHKPVSTDSADRLARPALTRLFRTLHRTKHCLIRCVRALVVHRGQFSTAIVVVERPPPVKKAEMLKRSRRRSDAAAAQRVAQERERHTPLLMAPPRLSSHGMMMSPLVFEDRFGGGVGSVETVRWDSMFQGLKPT